MTELTKGDFTRVKSDFNGTARYVIHYKRCMPKTRSIDLTYDYTTKLMARAGGTKYNSTDYPECIVFRVMNLGETVKNVNLIKQQAERILAETYR